MKACQWYLAHVLFLLQISALSDATVIERSLVSARGSAISIPLTKSASATSNGTVSVVRDLERLQAKLSRSFNNFRLNTGATHPGDKRNNQTQGAGVIALTDEQESLWQGTISVGTPPVSYLIDFDTGSSDLILPGLSCNVNCAGHKRYNPSASSTSVNLNSSTASQFGDGSSIAGALYNDTVTIAGLVATDQTLISATQYSDSFNLDNFSPDGLLGLAFQSLAQSGAPPVFQTLISEDKVRQGLFAVYLSEEGSELTIGETDSTKYSGSFTTLDVLTPLSFWAIAVSAAQTNSRTTNTEFAGVVDTGTTLMVTDPNSASQFYSHISGSRLQPTQENGGQYIWSIPCRSKVGFSIKVGPTSISVPDSDFVLDDGEGVCVGALTAIEDVDFWVLGDVFLRNVYTVFNADDLTVSFAKLA